MALEFHANVSSGTQGTTWAQLFPGDDRYRKVCLMAGSAFYVNDQNSATGRFYHNVAGTSPLRLPATTLSTLYGSSASTAATTITMISIDPSETWE